LAAEVLKDDSFLFFFTAGGLLALEELVAHVVC